MKFILEKKDNVFHSVQIERLSFEPNQAGFRCSCCVQSVKIQTACVTGVHIQKHAKGTKLRASTVGKKLFLLNPLLLLLLFSFTAPSPLLPFFAHPRRACFLARFLDLLAFSISPLEKWKETSTTCTPEN